MLRRDPLANPEPLIQRVHAYVAYYIGDGPEAEDVTSETFERALRYRNGYDPAKGEPIAWLIGIARRCLDGARAARAEPAEDVLETAGYDDLEESTLRRLTVAAAIAALDARDRELLALRYGADLTAGQIGELLGLRTNTVEVALHRMLARLRLTLEHEEQPDALAPRARAAQV
jgi:RNA polymerase sigma-70 factor (ECF subfamily)